ncbi:hypothetical protein C8Q75DRAFT_807747 [Abortiporus biennis]|nr:hypothetical protein C8Q75DRAFT_807747 [Abortiporus biennis]
MSSKSTTEPELPPGWIELFDEVKNHPYWVDTEAKPPRAIWVHPYDDEQFLDEHPDIRDRLSKHLATDIPPQYAPPSYDSPPGPSRSHGDSSSSHTHNYSKSISDDETRHVHEDSDPRSGGPKNSRNIFGMVKDHFIDTYEARTGRVQAIGEMRQQRFANPRGMRYPVVCSPPVSDPYQYGYGGRRALGRRAFYYGDRFGNGRDGYYGRGGYGGGRSVGGAGLLGGILIGEAIDNEGNNRGN